MDEAGMDGAAGAGYPTSLSASRANDFLTCPLLYRLRSIDRLPETPSAAALRGTLVHRALEMLFDHPADSRNVTTAALLLGQAWAELVESDPAGAQALMADAGLVGEPTVQTAAQLGEQILSPALPLRDTSFRMEAPSRLAPHAREMGFHVQLAASFAVRGFIDRIDVAPTGEVRIVDYKTGKAPGPAYESKAMFQMRFYALAWWRMTGDIPRLLQLLYLGSNEALRYVPEEGDLLATERKVLALKDAISAAAGRGDFQAKTSRLCDWCSYRDLCPAWGGTPPPMPALDTVEASGIGQQDMLGGSGTQPTN